MSSNFPTKFVCILQLPANDNASKKIFNYITQKTTISWYHQSLTPPVTRREKSNIANRILLIWVLYGREASFLYRGGNEMKYLPKKRLIVKNGTQQLDRNNELVNWLQYKIICFKSLAMVENFLMTGKYFNANPSQKKFSIPSVLDVRPSPQV